MTNDADYILGTHAEEMQRLGLQHRVWRARALDAWRRAGFTQGQTLIDVGAGPGYATLDLAELTGATGRVVALERSRRFLDYLEEQRHVRELANIETHEIDLDAETLPVRDADGAWVRWVFAFLRDPQAALQRVAAALKPTGVLVIHEYFDYSTWRVSPRSTELEEFVQVVIRSWRGSGGEPDIGLMLPHWLRELGFRTELRTIIDVVPRTNYVWEWPAAFMRSGLQRLTDLGELNAERAGQMLTALEQREADPDSLMVTPGVLEIIAVRGS